MVELLKQTRSLCAVCGEIVPAVYEVRESEQVFFSRTCPAHGTVETDLGSHAGFYRRSFEVEKIMLARYGMAARPISRAGFLHFRSVNQPG